MHILFLTDNFPPEVNAPATRTIEHCRAWVKAGAEVTVITCAPNFPQGKVYPGYRNRLYQSEMIDGIRVVRVWSYITRNAGFVRRILDYLSFAASATLAGLFERCDILVATSPQFFTTFAGSLLARLKRRPWVFELRDLWPESIRTVGAMRQSRLLDLFEKVELRLYRDAAVVIAVTAPFRDNLTRRGIDADKIHIVTNGANLDLYQPQPKNRELLECLGLSGKFIVGYLGTHGMAHSLEFIINSLDRVDDAAIHFLFIGDGAHKAKVMLLAGEKGLKNVTFLDPIPKEMVADYLSIIDVALVPLIKSETFKTVIPSKIFESAAMGIPILLGVEGEAQGIVEKYDAGLAFEPENEESFLATLQTLKSDREAYARMQQGCARLAAAYDRSALAGEMLGILAETAKVKGTGTF